MVWAYYILTNQWILKGSCLQPDDRLGERMRNDFMTPDNLPKQVHWLGIVTQTDGTCIHASRVFLHGKPRWYNGASISNNKIIHLFLNAMKLQTYSITYWTWWLNDTPFLNNPKRLIEAVVKTQILLSWLLTVNLSHTPTSFLGHEMSRCFCFSAAWNRVLWWMFLTLRVWSALDEHVGYFSLNPTRLYSEYEVVHSSFVCGWTRSCPIYIWM